jgi:hypothetical protein
MPLRLPRNWLISSTYCAELQSMMAALLRIPVVTERHAALAGLDAQRHRKPRLLLR